MAIALISNSPSFRIFSVVKFIRLFFSISPALFTKFIFCTRNDIWSWARCLGNGGANVPYSCRDVEQTIFETTHPDGCRKNFAACDNTLNKI